MYGANKAGLQGTVIGRPVRRGSGGGGGGDFEWLRPLYTLPTGLTFDAFTGKITGTTVDTTEPTWATTVALTDQGSVSANTTALQNELNSRAASATGNVRITLPAGVVYNQITLPAVAHGFWIGLYSASHASLPTPSAGTYTGSTKPTSAARINPVTHGALLPILRTSTGNTPALTTANGARRYYLRGLKFDKASTTVTIQGALLSVSSGSSTPADWPDRVIACQCWFDGLVDTTGLAVTRRAMLMDGTNLACVDSYVERICDYGSDSQAWLTLKGRGPYKLTNTYTAVTGAAENVMVGGAPLWNDNATEHPADFEVRWNVFDKPASYDFASQKNNFELKFMQRCLLEANEMPRHKGDSQFHSIVLKVTDQSGTGVNAKTEDVTCRFNRVTNSRGMMAVSGREFGPNLTTPTRRVDFRHNVYYDPLTTSGTRWAVQVVGDVEDVCIEHNTVQADGNQQAVSFTETDAAIVRLTCRYNVCVPASGSQAVQVFTPRPTTDDRTVTDNLLARTASSPGNLVTTSADPGFTNAAADDYTLTPASLGYRAVNGGRDAGAHWPLVLSELSGVL